MTSAAELIPHLPKADSRYRPASISRAHGVLAAVSGLRRGLYNNYSLDDKVIEEFREIEPLEKWESYLFLRQANFGRKTMEVIKVAIAGWQRQNLPSPTPWFDFAL